MRNQLDRFRGTEVKTTGDGFLAASMAQLGRSNAPWQRPKRFDHSVSSYVQGCTQVNVYEEALTLEE